MENIGVVSPTAGLLTWSGLVKGRQEASVDRKLPCVRLISIWVAINTSAERLLIYDFHVKDKTS